jgi:tRNA A37 threonylcarbamoyladenosine modification protein TsaB
VIDAKRGEVYVQAFSPAIEPLCAAQILPADDAQALLKRVLGGPCALTGSGAGLIDIAGSVRLEAQRIDALLLARRACLADPSRYPAVPAYLREPDARLPA